MIDTIVAKILSKSKSLSNYLPCFTLNLNKNIYLTFEQKNNLKHLNVLKILKSFAFAMNDNFIGESSLIQLSITLSKITSPHFLFQY